MPPSAALFSRRLLSSLRDASQLRPPHAAARLLPSSPPPRLPLNFRLLACPVELLCFLRSAAATAHRYSTPLSLACPQAPPTLAQPTQPRPLPSPLRCGASTSSYAALPSMPACAPPTLTQPTQPRPLPFPLCCGTSTSFTAADEAGAERVSHILRR
jgi:hypothetical protein